MMTLRQVEVIRAIMVAGTIAGAAKLLNVSAPGISRLVKYTERSLNVRFFQRQNGRYVPTPEARIIFEQINAVYDKVDDLAHLLSAIDRGARSDLRIASVPSLAAAMVPQAVQQVRRRFPDLRMDIAILKIEEVVDYLLLGRGECVAVSSQLTHPGVECRPLVAGRLFCVVAEGHALAGLASVNIAQVAAYPLIGIDPKDPYGAIMARLFAEQGLAYDVPIKARFGTMVCALVRAGLGIAVIDAFTLAGESRAGIRAVPIVEDTGFPTFLAVKRGESLSIHAEAFCNNLRAAMVATGAALTSP